jgi:diguanylate cyclase (GGDEF)-like protein
VTPNFEQDSYGTFLSGHAPIFDSQGNSSGFVGVDFDLQYYLARESRFSVIALGTLCAALFLALGAGYVVTLYLGAMRRRVGELYTASITDSLTGFLNRRGTMEVIKPLAERHFGPCALFVIDINGLKLINELRGHSTGDAVIAQASETIRQSVRPQDYCARVGGEFVIYAPDCALEVAEAIGRCIVAKVSDKTIPLVGANFSIAIGIATHAGSNAPDFAELYRDADLALSEAKAEGRNRFNVYRQPSAA